MAVKKPIKKSVKAVTKKIAPKVKTKPVVSKAKITKETAPKKVVSVAKTLGKLTKPLTKTELYTAIAEQVGLNRKQVVAVFDTLTEIMAIHLKKDGPEKFVLPGLLKVVVKKVPAKPAREGRNPFTGEDIMLKAKPASKKVKVVALTALKDMC